MTMGMGMTEKQGGSDVRANTTQAVPDGSDAWGERYRLVGHKWFMSAPMSDAFLVVAQTPAGPTCFFLPRWLPDGSLNAVRIQRLKDKLGNQANASSEVEFVDALAWRVGDEGRGLPQILAMGALTRLDCALGSAGLMRGALSLALQLTRAHRDGLWQAARRDGVDAQTCWPTSRSRAKPRRRSRCGWPARSTAARTAPRRSPSANTRP